MKQEMCWVRSLMKVYMGCYNYFIKHKNDLHAPAALQKLTIGYLVFESSKLKLRAMIYDGHLKRANIMYNG